MQTQWDKLRKDAQTVDGKINTAYDSMSKRKKSLFSKAIREIKGKVPPASFRAGMSIIGSGSVIASAMTDPDMPADFRTEYLKVFREFMPDLSSNLTHLALMESALADQMKPLEKDALAAVKANSGSDEANHKLDALVEKHGGKMEKVIADLADSDQPVGFIAPFIDKIRQIDTVRADKLDRIYDQAVERNGGLLPERAASQWQERVAASQPSSGKAVG